MFFYPMTIQWKKKEREEKWTEGSNRQREIVANKASGNRRTIVCQTNIECRPVFFDAQSFTDKQLIIRLTLANNGKKLFKEKQWQVELCRKMAKFSVIPCMLHDPGQQQKHKGWKNLSHNKPLCNNAKRVKNWSHK